MASFFAPLPFIARDQPSLYGRWLDDPNDAVGSDLVGLDADGRPWSSSSTRAANTSVRCRPGAISKTGSRRWTEAGRPCDARSQSRSASPRAQASRAPRIADVL